jgi:YD repeat-containing protein
VSGGRTGIDRVVLVYLREQREGLTPVLVTSEGEQVEVDSLRLRWLRTEQGSDLFPAPGPATIAPDGRHLVFAQPGEVVVLDVATAGVTRIPLPGAALMDAGWTTARTGIVARVSETQGWFIEADTWTAETGGARERYPAHYRLDLADGKGRLQTWDANGRLTSTTSTGVRLAATPGRSQTVGNVDGWAARAVALGPDTRETNLGVLAVQADRPSNRRFLVIPQGPRSQECCAPMGWVGGQTLLVQVVDEAQTWILAWDLTTGEVRKVTQITGGPPYAATAVASR